ncbi:MAG: hypothetical protein QOE63_764 [Acidimicrobiaceae bacterium]
MTTTNRLGRIGLRAMAVALMSMLVLTFSVGRASAVTPCSDQGDGNDPARHYVCNVYFFFLHPPTNGEVNYWIDVLSTDSTAAVAADLIGSQETAQRFVGDQYGNLLGRAGDPGGVHYWTDQLQAGVTFEDFDAALVSSDEAFTLVGGLNDNYVEYLYNVILDRSASDADISYWADLISNGTTTRAGVASLFVHSTEFAAMVVDGSYLDFLGRPADAGGLAYWTSFTLEHGFRMTYIALIGSAEGYAQLSSGLI